jgi:hypothetical protein
MFMGKPRITFYCELEADELANLFDQPGLIDDLQTMQVSVSLGILDLSPLRAGVIRKLNNAGIPVVAWLLLSKQEGYWCNLGNAPQAVDRYADIKVWSEQHGLRWDGIGLDIEPDIREMEEFAQARLRVGWRLLGRAFRQRNLAAEKARYHALVEQIRSDGYRVDVYQLPIMVDERSMHSSLLQRTLCLVDLPADREVLMLYSSFLRPRGPGFLWSYGPQSQSIGVGSTGGGVDIGVLDTRPLEWNELARDLRLAWVFGDDIHIFSLEGCVRAGFLKRLKDFEWDLPIIEPVEQADIVDGWRTALRSFLWLSAHPMTIILSVMGALMLAKQIRRLLVGQK